MEHGQVRAILGRHARGAAGADGGRGPDPTLLVPASSLRHALEGLGEPEQRALAHDYVRLWARTFRTLERHLRGRPERALALFAEEVYPFLRGDRRAARVERAGPREARVLLPADLPPAYHAGLVEGFVALSGAEASARPDGAGAFRVTFHVAPADRLARAAQTAATLRLPLLACAALAALTGIAVAALDGADARLAALVLLGLVAAQLGANALHDLRQATPPLAAVRLPPAARWAILLGAYGVAAACAAALVAARGYGILALASLGLLLGLAYARFRDGGLGPVVAGLTFGGLVPLGAAYALGAPQALVAAAPLFGAPLGLMAAALLLLDNMADRPLDEAGGQRTLAVRLPSRGQAATFAALVALALAALAATGWPWASPLPAAAALALAPAAWLVVRRVRRAGDDPRRLGAARLGAFALLAAVALAGLAHLATGAP